MWILENEYKTYLLYEDTVKQRCICKGVLMTYAHALCRVYSRSLRARNPGTSWKALLVCPANCDLCPAFQAIESAIGGNAYQHSKVNQWTTNVVEQTLSQLTKLGKPFKYIVTCVIMQKNGAGLHTASSCFWDSSTDGSCTVRWENKTMYCIVSAFGLSI